MYIQGITQNIALNTQCYRSSYKNKEKNHTDNEEKKKGN